jgi:oxalate decarboxylase/phosphoglucose isomerase-like protein (cupin superfamily)
MVKIEKASIWKQDERGIAYGFSARDSSYFIVLYRKAGTTSGDHYHKGTIESKNPEVFYFVSGKAELVTRDINTGEEQVFQLEEGLKIEIPPNIYHSFRALTDIILLELNTSEEDFNKYEADTVKI